MNRAAALLFGTAIIAAFVVGMGSSRYDGRLLETSQSGQGGPTPTPACDPEEIYPCPLLTAAEAESRMHELFSFQSTGVTVRMIDKEVLFEDWLLDAVPAGEDPAAPMWLVTKTGFGLALFDIMPPPFVDLASLSPGANRPVEGAYAGFEASSGDVRVKGVIEVPGVNTDPASPYLLSRIGMLPSMSIVISSATPYPTSTPYPTVSVQRVAASPGRSEG